ncbi:eIF-2-alpha kinase GCN2 [Lolium perenne]|uniref:eIF-2-alpha kinase GCN2 n=1 Tax=Lolium perenne TaxID=4522 RepID=UPI0021F5B323|nr:uncharacterized protein LOC127335941 [Lolium perenne]
MAPDSPPQPVLSGRNLRARIFSISADEQFSLLSEMQGLTGDRAGILIEQPASAAIAQPGDLILSILYEGRIHMAYVSMVDVGGGAGSEDGGSSSSTDPSEDEDDGVSSSTDSIEDGEQGSTEARDEEGKKQSVQSSTVSFSSNLAMESEDKELKERNRHLHIRVWPQYCVLVFFDGECWKVTKQQPMQWLQTDQMEEINQRIMTENERVELDWTKNLAFVDLSKQMSVLGFVGLLECSEAVDNFIRRDLSPDIMNYNINDVIGDGATCTVYGVSTRYAIKKMELTEDFDDKDAIINREPREVIILSSFRHTAVVSFFQAWAANGKYISGLSGSSQDNWDDEDSEPNVDLEDERERIYVAVQMEYCGRTLLEFLDPEYHEVDVEEAWVIFRDITKGVQRIHRSGVIHRDLKPQNIFFGYADSRAIKIGDFGHACWAKQYANGEVGTPNRGTTIYCAPELNEETCVTEKADIYSLGIIFVELFHHFKGGYERVEVFTKLRNGEYPNSPDWYGDLTLLKQLVGPPPSQRLSTDEILEYISNRTNVVAGQEVQ